jgi:hypothetical protein
VTLRTEQRNRCSSLLIINRSDPAAFAEEGVKDSFLRSRHGAVVELGQKRHGFVTVGTIGIFRILQPHWNTAQACRIWNSKGIGGSEWWLLRDDNGSATRRTRFDAARLVGFRGWMQFDFPVVVILGKDRPVTTAVWTIENSFWRVRSLTGKELNGEIGKVEQPSETGAASRAQFFKRHPARDRHIRHRDVWDGHNSVAGL